MVQAGKYVVKITDTADGTTITYTAGTNAATTTTKDDWRTGMQAALEELGMPQRLMY